MFRSILLLAIVIPFTANCQPDTSKWLRAFPITDYMVDLNDSVRVVQLHMPEGHVIKDKQLGMLWGVYDGSKDEAVQKGYGRCHLIKGDYYYFSMGNNKSGLSLKAGDLIYTFMDRTAIHYGQVPQLAGHFIRLQDVHGNFFYDRYTIFHEWTIEMENTALDSMVSDIRFTGSYFLGTEPSMNQLISEGDYKNQRILEVMKTCRTADLKDFLDYILAMPRLYAGKEWKLTEIFATWLANSAPKLIKN